MNEFISSSIEGKVKIDFDTSRKVFFLSIPIFSSSGPLPKSVKQYVEARQNHSFNPYRTSFCLEGESQVNLIQELPFHWGFQPSFREQVQAFQKLALKCHQILLEIAIEEKLEQVESHLLDTILWPSQ